MDSDGLSVLCIIKDICSLCLPEKEMLEHHHQLCVCLIVINKLYPVWQAVGSHSGAILYPICAFCWKRVGGATCRCGPGSSAAHRVPILTVFLHNIINNLNFFTVYYGTPQGIHTKELRRGLFCISQLMLSYYLASTLHKQADVFEDNVWFSTVLFFFLQNFSFFGFTKALTCRNDECFGDPTVSL